MSKPRIFSGARAIIKIDNKLVVYALTVQYSVETQYKPLSTVDNSLPEELAPGNINVQLRCGTLRVPKESASVLAYQPTILNNLHQRYVAIEIRDRSTNDVMLYIPKAMMTRRDGQVSSRQLAGETWAFTGIGYWDERPPQGATENTNSNQIGKIARQASSKKKNV